VSAAADIARLEPEAQVAELAERRAALRITHNSGRMEWFTPPWFVELAREALGGIDLDPASCAEANEVVQASRFYTADDDGLSQPWKGRVFVNPPYAMPLVENFARKLVDEYEAGNVSAGVWLSNNATETGWFQHLARYASAICFPRRRLAFWQPGAETPAAGGALQGQVVVYVGSDADRFMDVFQATGLLVRVVSL
jgi:ParB family chromosome partitioning protein